MVANSYKPGSIESAMQSPATTETPELKNGEYWVAKIRTLMLEFNIESSTEMEKFFNDFKDNDTPAASLHHNNFKWGLWEHLYNVARYMLKWNKDDALGYNNASCLKVALLHDAGGNLLVVVDLHGPRLRRDQVDHPRLRRAEHEAVQRQDAQQPFVPVHDVDVVKVLGLGRDLAQGGEDLGDRHAFKQPGAAP